MSERGLSGPALQAPGAEKMSERREAGAPPSSERGFTLVELLVAIMILGIITAPLSMAVITGLRFLGRSDQKLNDSRSALISAAYFAGDVGNANLILPNDAAACGGGTALVSFDWSDASLGAGAAVNNEASYVFDSSDPANKRLLRKYCANGGSATQSTAAVSLGSTPVVTCYNAANVVNATCVSARWVKMLVTQNANTPSADNPAPVPYTFTLEGTRRTQ
jgi:prepilin-type N-terminal cleavage/methylation domain-containing protein